MPTKFLQQLLQPTPGWYRGDFHSHTTCSDGLLSPQELVQEAVDLKLDFLAITDHNILEPFEQLSPRPDLLIVPGMEVTLTDGHYNIFGLGGWERWLDVLQKESNGPGRLETRLTSRKPADLVAAGRRRRLFQSLNHPLLPPWAWQDDSLPLASFDSVEIWHNPTWPDNETINPATVAMWTRWLNAGHRHVAIGGSDYHGSAKARGTYQPRLGLPTTWVYAPALSVEGILTALRGRRAYITTGPTLALTSIFDGFVVQIGDDLGPAAGTLHIALTAGDLPPDATFQMIRRGEIAAEGSGPSWQVSVPLDPERTNDWLRFDIRSASGELLTLTNPIFCGTHRPPQGDTFGDFVTADS